MAASSSLSSASAKASSSATPIASSNSPAAFASATTLLAHAFVDDPVVRYLLNTLPSSSRTAFIPVFFGKLLTAARLNGGWVDATPSSGDDSGDEEEGDDDKAAVAAQSCAVYMPPGRKIDDDTLTLVRAGALGLLWTLGVKGVWRLMTELGPMSDRAKSKVFSKEQKYSYVFFVGTEKEHRGKGLSSHLLRAHQAHAASLGLPCWLEATTVHSRDIYARLGFEVVEEMVLGKGVAAADGSPEQGGKGITIWGMVWWPPKAEA